MADYTDIFRLSSDLTVTLCEWFEGALKYVNAQLSVMTAYHVIFLVSRD